MSHHGRQEHVLRGVESARRDGLALQILNCAHAVRAEQLKTADVNPGQDDDRMARVKRDYERRGEVHFDVEFAVTEELRARYPARPLDISDVGKALRGKQLRGDEQRRRAYAV